MKNDITKVFDLEEVCTDLRNDATALRMVYVAWSDNDDGKYSRDALADIAWIFICMLEQHVSDVERLYSAMVRRGMGNMKLSTEQPE